MAVNAILTWVKLFKFLDFHPQMSIFTTTIGKAAGPLKCFLCSFLIVLIGSGQGFYLAFGLDLVDYRGFVYSILALLRMAVGDFDYDVLIESQYYLGPIFFWVYIVLVFFVLMSMFIAMVSEAYEDARDEADKRVPIGISGRLTKFSSWSEATKEAGNRLKILVHNRIISHQMTLEFKPFLEALPKLQRDAVREDGAKRRRRRFSRLCRGGALWRRFSDLRRPRQDERRRAMQQFLLTQRERFEGCGAKRAKKKFAATRQHSEAEAPAGRPQLAARRRLLGAQTFCAK